MPSAGRVGSIPRLQFLAVRRDEAHHRAWIQTADVDELEALASRLDGDGVGVVVMADFFHLVK